MQYNIYQSGFKLITYIFSLIKFRSSQWETLPDTSQKPEILWRTCNILWSWPFTESESLYFNDFQYIWVKFIQIIDSVRPSSISINLVLIYNFKIYLTLYILVILNACLQKFDIWISKMKVWNIRNELERKVLVIEIKMYFIAGKVGPLDMNNGE